MFLATSHRSATLTWSMSLKTTVNRLPSRSPSLSEIWPQSGLLDFLVGVFEVSHEHIPVPVLPLLDFFELVDADALHRAPLGGDAPFILDARVVEVLVGHIQEPRDSQARVDRVHVLLHERELHVVLCLLHYELVSRHQAAALDLFEVHLCTLNIMQSSTGSLFFSCFLFRF